MSDASAKPRFELTARQRRLRVLTFVILGAIALMLAFSYGHPFFHPVRPPVLTDRMRKALAVQYMMILGYYTVVFIFAMSLLLIAWLYIRDIRVQLLIAQRDIWQEIKDRQAAERETKSKPKRNGSNN